MRDPYAVPDDGHDWRDTVEAGVADLTVGVLRRPGFDAPLDAEGVAAVEHAAVLLSEAGASVEEADPGLPDTRAIFAGVWGAGLARLSATLPEQLRGLLDPGIREVAERLGGMTAIQYLDGEAMRAAAAHAMARLHQRFDLVLCPTVPAGPPLADAPTVDPVRGAVDAVGAVDVHLQPDAPAGDHRAVGAARRTGCRTRCSLPQRSTARTWCCARRGRSSWRSRSRRGLRCEASSAPACLESEVRRAPRGMANPWDSRHFHSPGLPIGFLPGTGIEAGSWHGPI